MSLEGGIIFKYMYRFTYLKGELERGEKEKEKGRGLASADSQL